MERDLRISNAKGLLIFLVVFGHLIELSKYSNYELFVFIYAFHMPLFIFISGYLAKRVKVSKIINLILLYLIFQTIFNYFRYLMGTYETIPFHYGTPQFHLWYLVSLGIWYAAAFLLLKLKLTKCVKWVIFIVIVAISFISRWYASEILVLVKNNLFVGFDTYTLSYQRTLSFAPFFFAGFFINKEWFDKISNLLRNQTLKVIGSIAIITFAFVFIENTNRIENAFRGSFGGVMFLDEQNLGAFSVVVLAHYLIATILCILILNWVSKGNTALSYWGDASLTIFLFHPVFVFIIQKHELLSLVKPNTQIVICIFISTLICYVLASKLFVKITNPLCNPYFIIKNIKNKG
ncbi:acyltransferase family protein [Ornithinibacillus bavariensis]|uniref:Acyltransferase n=1 Tax=Ornithinibacillus bavariensis TaxID=545502 RepID=A0A920C6A2_9BACI|nr:acyltransferase family protein [Ornithinibacillus bavariensis]GIO26383.1 acyltransferase [Ornithinibacillus bavariensis]